MSDILARIFAAKAVVRACDEEKEPYEIVCARGLSRKAERRGFRKALDACAGPAIIGEIKRASPSVGLISRNFEPAAIAAAYDRAGVEAVSVLTESDHFLGELGYLDAVRARTARPILRKDFLSTPYEVAQSAAYGADAILLIVGGLSDEALRRNIEESARYDLDVLVEVHDSHELRRAMECGVALLGINNRNLRTFETDLSVSEHLIPHVAPGVTIVSESGMRGADDITRLYAAGAKGFLIGETLMRAADPAQLIAELKNAGRSIAL